MAANSNSGTTRRLHSNTISGVRPPNIDTSPMQHVRRNSEGSPQVAPPINISGPTPTTPLDSSSLGTLSLDHFPRDQANEKNSSRSASPVPTPVVGPEAPAVETTTATAVPLRLIPSAKKSRSRGSSVSTTNTADKAPHPSSASIHSERKPRRGSNDSEDTGMSSDGGESAVVGSIASACGVELAIGKRNQEFHALFRSVPEEDALIEDFGCALQKEILVQGRIYISENHVCFNANIFGWVTNLVIAFSEIVDIEKRTTAMIIPNAIQISTLHAKHSFASFLSRDQAYDLLVDVWRCARPTTAQTGSGDTFVQEDGMDESYDESDASYTGTDTDINDYDEEDEPSDEFDTMEGAKQSDNESGHGRQSSLASLPLTKGDKKEDLSDAARRRAMSEGTRPNPQDLVMSKDDTKNGNGVSRSASTTGDKSKVAQTHEKTECECSGDDHFPSTVLDKTYSTNMTTLYDLLYSDDNFMKEFLTENQKTLELEIGPWKEKDKENSLKCRELSYIKPLNSTLGPKQTKCLLKEEVERFDPERSISVLTITQTPDVPSGSSFTVKTRLCMTWAGKGQVRVLVNVLVDFTKSSWLKSTIEKASIDGQSGYYKDLDSVIRKRVEVRERDSKTDRRKKGKRKRRPNESRKNDASHEPSEKLGRGVFAHILSDASSCARWIMENAFMPSTAQLTVTCMFLMVLINLFIAGKMADVERQLDQLGSTSFPSILVEHQARHIVANNEADDLWDWLGLIDPGQEKLSARAARVFHRKEGGDTHDKWDTRGFQNAQATKDRLDEYMLELSKMVQRAEQSMEQVNKVIDQQKERVQHEVENEQPVKAE